MSQEGPESTETVDAEIVDGTALELVPSQEPQPVTLFRTDDPEEVVERASKVAAALKKVITGQKLATRISGREHVRVEGWQTLGTMLGVTAVCTWTRKVGDDESGGWEARVEARTLDGRVIGAAEAECLRAESKWKNRDSYALRSMAQTRATSKALRSVLSFVVTLAGYDPTPAEEMDGVVAQHGTPQYATTEERRLIFAKAKDRDIGEGQLKAIINAVADTDRTDRIPRSRVGDVLAAIATDGL